MGDDDQVREVRQRMAALRRNLDGDMRSVTDSARAMAHNARAMADWRFYVHRFPIAAAGLAAAVGYIFVPKRPHVVVPDADALAAMAKKHPVWISTRAPKANAGERGALGSLLALVGSAAAKFAVNWAGQQLKNSVAASASSQDHGTHAEPERQSSSFPPK